MSPTREGVAAVTVLTAGTYAGTEVRGWQFGGRSESVRSDGPFGELKVRQSTVQRFMRDGRLLAIPARRSKRLEVLDVLAQEFEPGRHYPEVEVNRRLRTWYVDVAALRRYLVDEGFLDRTRDCGEYWRIGGSVAFD